MIKINWSEYIREAIRHKITLEKKRAAEKLLQDLKDQKIQSPQRLHKQHNQGDERDPTRTYVISSKKIGATLLTADDTLHKKAFREIPTLHLKNYKE